MSTAASTGRDGTQTVTIPSATTGVFEDTTNVDTLADGDAINWRHGNDAGIGSMELDVATSRLVSTASKFLLGHHHIPGVGFNDGLDRVDVLGGAVKNGVTLGGEAFVRTVIRTAITLENMSAYVSNNSLTSGAAHVELRKNGATANNVLSWDFGTTEVKTASATDAVSAGDDINARHWSPTSSGALHAAVDVLRRARGARGPERGLLLRVRRHLREDDRPDLGRFPRSGW